MKNKAIVLLASAALALPTLASAAATVNIVNGDGAGVGFNDTTAVAPVGGNNGTTLGQQRLIAYQRAAQVWGSTLTSTVPINVYARWTALTCDAASAVLGSAGASQTARNFPNAPFTGTLYSIALADKLAGSEQGTITQTSFGSTTPVIVHINANFNVNLGTANCLSGSPFYLGLDSNPPGTQIDLIAVLIHELGHGLGFQTFTSGTTGAYSGGFPSIWDRFLTDSPTNQSWIQLTAAQRAASAISDKLVWSGPTVTSNVPNVLQLGSPNLRVNSTTAGAQTYAVGTASFGPALASPGLTAQVVQVVDTAGSVGLACTALSPANAAAVNGKIALVDRGTCAFTVKVKACQDAGAVGVIVVDNAAGSPPAGLGGADATVTIPAVRVTIDDGNAIKAALAKRTRTTPANVVATLGLDTSIRAGTDGQGRVKMYAPNPFISGSSVSHYDVSATPNLIMEPSINTGLQQSVVPPQDLTFPLLQDTGW